MLANIRMSAQTENEHPETKLKIVRSLAISPVHTIIPSPPLLLGSEAFDVHNDINFRWSVGIRRESKELLTTHEKPGPTQTFGHLSLPYHAVNPVGFTVKAKKSVNKFQG